MSRKKQVILLCKFGTYYDISYNRIIEKIFDVCLTYEQYPTKEDIFVLYVINYRCTSISFVFVERQLEGRIWF